MVSLSLVLIALAVLASFGCWLLMRGLWPEGERDFRAYGLAATGVLLLLGAVGLLALMLPHFGVAFHAKAPPVTPMPEGELRVDFPPTPADTDVPQRVAVGDESLSARTDFDDEPSAARANDATAFPAVDDRERSDLEDWPATDCVVRYRSPVAMTGEVRWFLRNECGRPVAVMFAWCDLPATECLSLESDRAGLRWIYVEEGIVLIADGTRPPVYEILSGAPPVSPFASVAPTPTDNAFVDHLACYVTSTTANDFLGRSQAFETEADLQRAEEMFEISDECLRVVRSCSRFGNALGRSPASLFR